MSETHISRVAALQAVVVLGLTLMLSLTGGLPAHAGPAVAPAPAAGPAEGDTLVGGQLPTPPIQAVFASYEGYGAFALGADGRLYYWDYSNVPNFTDFTDPNWAPMRNVPVDVGLDQTFVSVNPEARTALDSAGNIWNLDCAIQSDVNDKTVGYQCTSTEMPIPPGVTAFTDVAYDWWDNATFALDESGNVWVWGDGFATPTLVSGLTGITAIIGNSFSDGPGYASENGILALAADGTVWAWGFVEPPPSGPSTPIPAPLQVPGLANVTTLDRGYTQDSSGIWWMINGNLTSTPLTATQVALPAGLTLTAINVGDGPTLALASDGTVWGWGTDYGQGQLGPDYVDATVPSTTPVQIPVPAGATQLVVTSMGGLTVYSDGTMWVWGAGPDGDPGMPPAGAETAPFMMRLPETVTSVTFGGVAGTNLSQTGSTWTVDTPGGCGPVDVVVDWQLGEVVADWGNGAGPIQTMTYPDGFVYGTPPAITTQPSSATITPGGTFTTSIAVTGDDPPTIQWQSSPDGTTWTDIPGATSATLNALDVTTATQYQAVVTNCWTGLDAAAYTLLSNKVRANIQTGPPIGVRADTGGHLADPAPLGLATTALLAGLGLAWETHRRQGRAT